MLSVLRNDMLRIAIFALLVSHDQLQVIPALGYMVVN